MTVTYKTLNLSSVEEFEKKHDVSYDEFVNFMIYNPHQDSHLLLDVFKRNKESFDYAGITNWHNHGEYGKGVRIGIIDAEWNVDESYLKDHVELRHHSYGDDMKDGDHGYKSCAVANIVAPQAEFVLFPANIFAFSDLSDYDLDLVTMSMGSEKDGMGKYDDKDWTDGRYFLVAAAGNENASMISYPAKSDGSLSVGAAYLKNGDPKRKNYSNRGDMLNIMGLTDIYIPGLSGELDKHTGTSAACPLVAGMLALLIGKYGSMSNEELKQLIYENTEDMRDMGFDECTGEGLFTMPQL